MQCTQPLAADGSEHVVQIGRLVFCYEVQDRLCTAQGERTQILRDVAEEKAKERVLHHVEGLARIFLSCRVFLAHKIQGDESVQIEGAGPCLESCPFRYVAQALGPTGNGREDAVVDGPLAHFLAQEVARFFEKPALGIEHVFHKDLPNVSRAPEPGKVLHCSANDAVETDGVLAAKKIKVAAQGKEIQGSKLYDKGIEGAKGTFAPKHMFFHEGELRTAQYEQKSGIFRVCQGKPCKLGRQFRKGPCKIGVLVHDEHKGLFRGVGKQAFQRSFHGLHGSIFHPFRRKEAREHHGVAQVFHIDGCRIRACCEEDSGLVLQKVADEGCLAHSAPAVQNNHTKSLPGPQPLKPCFLLFTANEHRSSTKK